MSPPESPLPIETSCPDVHAAQTGGEDFLLVDCREPDEFALVKIPGARLLPLGELPARLAELEPYRERRIVVHCHHGGRSLRAANWLRANGFSQAQSLAGGIDAWAQQIDSALPRYPIREPAGTGSFCGALGAKCACPLSSAGSRIGY